MNTSVKSSHPLRYAVLGATAVLSICFWLLRFNLTPAQLPSLPRLGRHDTARAAPIALPAKVEIAPAPAVAIPAKLETQAIATPTAAAPAGVPANLAPAVEVLPTASAAPSATGLTADDRSFFEKAGQAGIQQDKVSRGVLNQVVYPEVREYIYGLLDEQAAINAELLALAAHKQVVVPMPDRVPFRRWSHEEGSIDQHYINLLVETNTEAVALYEKAAQSDDADIAAYARKTLPVIQRRLSAVRALKKITD